MQISRPLIDFKNFPIIPLEADGGASGASLPRHRHYPILCLVSIPFRVWLLSSNSGSRVQLDILFNFTEEEMTLFEFFECLPW